MVLSLENAVVPPNVNFNTPNPASMYPPAEGPPASADRNLQVPWEEAMLVVPTKAVPWPPGRMKRVSVNSFGIGGTNAHVRLASKKHGRLLTSA